MSVRKVLRKDSGGKQHGSMSRRVVVREDEPVQSSRREEVVRDGSGRVVCVKPRPRRSGRRVSKPRRSAYRVKSNDDFTFDAPVFDEGKTYVSPPLDDIPERVLIVDDKGFAGATAKFADAFRLAGIEVIHINAKRCTMTDSTVVKAFDYDHGRMLVLYYDPGDTWCRTDVFTPNVNSPPDVPFGIIRGSSFYRVDNFRIAHGHQKAVPRTGRTNMLPPRPSCKFNFGKMERMNRFFDELTPLILVGTEDLMRKYDKSMFLGQPQLFEPFDEGKAPDSIIHISSPSFDRDIKKGTAGITKAFDKIKFMKTKTIGVTRVPHIRCMKELRRAGMCVHTLTNWDYGMGYVGLESCATSCLGMSRCSGFAPKIRSEIVNVRTPMDIVNKAYYFHNNVDEYHAKRKRQYDWASGLFSYEAVANRFMSIVGDVVAAGWKFPGRRYYV